MARKSTATTSKFEVLAITAGASWLASYYAAAAAWGGDVAPLYWFAVSAVTFVLAAGCTVCAVIQAYDGAK